MWDEGAEDAPTRSTKPRVAAGHTVRARNSEVRVMDALRAVAARIDVSVEAVALVVLLVAMVGFVIHWTLMIFG